MRNRTEKFVTVHFVPGIEIPIFFQKFLDKLLTIIGILFIIYTYGMQVYSFLFKEYFIPNMRLIIRKGEYE